MTQHFSAVNRRLDRLVRPTFHLFSHTFPAFLVCGYTGLGAAIFLTISLTAVRGLSPLVMIGSILAAMATFLALAMVTKIITGHESLTYYHHEVAVLLTVTLLLWITDQPILPYLDGIILGVGLFLAFGRVGCFMVGCCHGRPTHWGVCYRDEHADAGFAAYFVGIRLFPVQIIESTFVFFLVVVGSGMVLNDWAAGEALAWYIIMYDVGRFGFELLRGDAARLYRGTFSEAQWTSLLLIFAVVVLELVGTIPFHAWHVGVAVGMVVVMIAFSQRRRRDNGLRFKLLHPRHVREVAEIVGGFHVALPSSDQSNLQPHIFTTSLGLQLSAGAIDVENGVRVEHYTMSNQHEPLTVPHARVVANLLMQLNPQCDSHELIAGNQGVYHVVLHPIA